jgi:molybdopterin-guanine dinucleotide biosynthesis protein A
MEMTGIVLAGGQSRRMGRDKALLEVGGVPMIRRVVETLRSVCVDVLIVTKTPETYADLDVRVVADAYPQQAPLAGLCTGLGLAATPWVFAAACDLPMLSAAAVRRLAALAPGYDAVVPRLRGRWHPLHAVYATAVRAEFERRLRAGTLALVDALRGLRVCAVGARLLEEVDPGLCTLRNINTEADYRAVLAQPPR